MHAKSTKNFIHLPATELYPIICSWLFAQWGLNIIDPLIKVPRSIKYLLVAIDYFTKLVDAKPLIHITIIEVQKFLWQDIGCDSIFPTLLFVATEINSILVLHIPYVNHCGDATTF